MRYVLIITMAVLCAALFSGLTYAQGASDPADMASEDTETKRGLEVGAAIPALELENAQGEQRRFEDLSGRRGLLLVFVRSADWCPYCKMQLIELADHAAEFEALGFPVVTVSYDPAEKLASFKDEQDIGYTMLSDPDSDIIKAFDLLNETVEKDSFAYGIPHPAVFVIGRDRKIKAKYYESGYKARPPVSMIVEGLKDLGLQ